MTTLKEQFTKNYINFINRKNKKNLTKYERELLKISPILYFDTLNAMKRKKKYKLRG